MAEAIATVQQFFLDRGIPIEIHVFEESSHTAEQAAQRLATQVGNIVKSLLFEADGQPILVLCAGDRRVDTGRLAALSGAQQVVKASARQTKQVTGYSIGGVPPVAHATSLPVFMDEALLRCDVVYAAAGTARSIFAIPPARLQEVCQARIGALSAL